MKKEEFNWLIERLKTEEVITEYLTDENIDNGIVEGYLEFLQDDDMDSLIYEVIDNSYELINY